MVGTFNMSLLQQVALPAHQMAVPARKRDYLHGPIADFMLLGGGSMILILALAPLFPASKAPALASFMLFVSNFINNPHFGHSYQIFYRGFRRKAFGGDYSSALRARYVFAGVIAPALLAGYMIGTFALGHYRAFGFAFNIMGFFVGWHYVKQGYGMLMLDSAIKQRFLTQTEKRLFLANAYATWLLAWINSNMMIRESDLWGLKSYTFDLPRPLLYIALAAAATTFALCIFALIQRHRSGGKLAWNGVIAYLVSIYPWLAPYYFGPVAYLVVPACHSLQYLAVVWRYQLNREQAEAAMEGVAPADGGQFGVSPGRLRFATFITKGALLGFAGFWGLPIVLDTLVPYNHTPFGGTVFLAGFWIFINVHHYFLDNVMWRRENTDIKQHLFG